MKCLKTLRCQIKKLPNGKHVTQVDKVYHGGEIEVKTVPTPPSQIRKPRVSQLWKPEV